MIRPQTRGVKCVVLRKDGNLLLVRLNYAHRRWTFPGGGVDKHEEFKDAAVRELFEETGIQGVSLEQLGEYSSNREYKRDTVAVFFGRVGDVELGWDPVEISEVGWFPLDALSLHTSPRVQQIIEQFDLQNRAKDSSV